MTASRLHPAWRCLRHFTVRSRFGRKWLALAIVASGCLAGSPTSAAGGDTPGVSRCVGFNYFHETWTDSYRGGPKFPKTDAQTAADFDRMKRLGATAVRIHGANNKTVQKVVGLAKAKNGDDPGLQVWLSFRPNMRDLDVAQNEDEKDKHPTYPCTLPKCYFVDPETKKHLTTEGVKRVLLFRKRFVQHFSAFLKETASLLKPGDVLIVANEPAIDLGYEFDNTFPGGENPPTGEDGFVSEGMLLQHLFAMAQKALGPDIELTFAAMPPGNERLSDRLSPDDWSALYSAGMDFVSLNCYWSSQNLRKALADLQTASKSPAMAVTEFGAVAHVNAHSFGGDGGQSASREVQEYNSGKGTQREGVEAQLGEIEGSPLRGLFVFAWDEPYDNVFGIVQTNATPLDHNLRDEHGHGDTWTDGCEFKMDAYLPVGKDACVALAQRWTGAKDRPLGVRLLKPPTELALAKVELCRHQGLPTDARTTLQCTLKTKSRDYGAGVCQWHMMSGEAETTFWLLDDPATHSLIFNWRDGTQTAISLDSKSDSAPAGELFFWRKDYDPQEHLVTISFEPSECGMLDVVFCIDISGSMGDDIEAVKSKVDEVLARFDERAKTDDISLRLGLVTYTRHTEPNWLAAKPLTSDIRTIRDAIMAIKITDPALGKCGNEDTYGAVMYAMNQTVEGQSIDMGWRGGDDGQGAAVYAENPSSTGTPVDLGDRAAAAKIIITMGDEPQDDPDWENRTLDQVAEVARNLDPVHIYPIVLPKEGSALLNSAVAAKKRIADATGGELIQISAAADLPDALVSTLQLAIRRHREEIWRKENPPWGLFFMAGAIGVFVVAATVAAIFAQIWRRRPATAPDGSPLLERVPDPTLTGQYVPGKPND
ncbi:MAG: VWA domain-containing protein [Planctomycetia bacterium]|nr:VWA domain-containing protein [Planctomycetia bacterium]